jgi:hypothetical protein
MQKVAAELIQVLRLDVLRIDHPRFHMRLPAIPFMTAICAVERHTATLAKRAPAEPAAATGVR